MSDRLVFEDERGRRSAPWPGAWPPPERLYLVGEDARQAVMDPLDCTEAALSVLQARGRLFVRRSASEIAEPAREDEYWFRGALYTPDKVKEAAP